MATRSSILAWGIPWTEEPVGHDLVTKQQHPPYRGRQGGNMLMLSNHGIEWREKDKLY